MHPSIRNVISLLLALSSAGIVSRSLAQTAGDSNTNNNRIILSSQSTATTDKTPTSNFSNSGSSTNSKPVVVSDAASNASSDKTKGGATNPNPRILIPSRIFTAPSMQQ